MSDPFEEFEFKPLTEGLGFHKKKNVVQGLSFEIENSLHQDAKDLAAKKSSEHLLQSTGLDLIAEPMATSMSPGMSTPLPRKKAKIENIEIDNSKSAVDEILSTLNKRRMDIDFDSTKQQLKATAKEPKVATFTKTTISFSAAFLDGMLVLAASLLCMIALLLITKVDLVANLSSPDDEGMIYLATFSVFAGVTFIYLLVNRAFLGYTPGEWAFDMRLGTPQDLEKPTYILKVMTRSVLQIATGLIILPILSLIFKKDLAGEISGASMMKRV